MAPPKRRRISGPASAARTATPSQRTLNFRNAKPNTARASAKQIEQPPTKAQKRAPDVAEIVTEDEEAQDAVAAPPKLDAANVIRNAETLVASTTAEEAERFDESEEEEEDEEDVAARKVSETKIKQYWQAKERERKAPRVHQEGLTVREKVLREFDMHGSYGPSIGITRLARWKRANKLNLHPPLEVLAVLLKEEEQGKGDRMQKSIMDELMMGSRVKLDAGIEV